MTFNLIRKRALQTGVALPALALLSVGLATPAFAQDAAADSCEPGTADCADSGAIIVTGSLFRRTDTETPSPVTMLSAEALQERGINTVSEAVQRLSANGAGTITQGWNVGSNFATGANAVSLRGLTVQSTLTIFDGIRMAPYPLADDGHRNFVDLNVIPNSIIDRIEVLRDGASSTYGADAVAGVVNVITKREITGLHFNGSVGASQHGDASEQRIDLTYGYGDLDDQGFNFYVNGEYQRQAALYARDRGYPFNTSDLSQICGKANGENPLFPAGTTVCMPNNIRNALTPNTGGSINPTTYPFTYNGTSSTPVPTVRPVDATGAAIPGQLFRLLNTADGCRDLTPIQVPLNGQGGTATAGGTLQCSLDVRERYGQLQPEQERLGFSGRFTARIGENAEFYASANYYQVITETTAVPSALSGNLPPPNPQGFAQPSNLYLPVYVCSTGVGNRLMLNTGCDATNGVLNPSNPFAADGRRAQVLATYDRERIIQSKARSLRGAIGLSGSIADWNYQVEATASQVQLDINQYNYVIPQRLWNALAQGTYNFMNPSQNSQAVRDYVAPLNSTRSFSDLWQVSATVSKELFELPGGMLGIAGGLSYRHESIDNPSANPFNAASPYDRYFTVNAVGATGSRNVRSAFYEINAPIIDMLEVNASGRYDDYSSGQSNFSPKFGAKFTPVREFALRGTWSKGFRIPSFNEAYGLPTTGYVTYTLNASNPAEAAFIAAHGGNSYGTGNFSVGLTATGNPALAPEKSTSWTVGGILEPMRNVSFTVDYWNIKVKDIIGGADYSDVRNQYYANNGVVNIPGINVVAGTPDINFPNALPHLGFIEYSFQNNDSQSVSGVDFGANVRYPITNDITLTSSLEASYLLKFEKSIGGSVQRYDGTLSPCDVTSCSGAPKWRGSWQNTVEWKDVTASVTAYYTGGYDLASIDYGGVKGDCAASIGASVVTYQDGTTPVSCRGKATWNADFTASWKARENFTFYVNVLNFLNLKAPFDPSAGYSLYQYNPAWAGANMMGRYFRVGARVDF